MNRYAPLGQAYAQDLRVALVKAALDIGEGGAGGQWLSSQPLARLLTTLNLTAPIVAGPSAYEKPEKDQHADVAMTMEQAKPEALGNTKLRLGGSDLKDDLLWKRDHNPEEGWTKRIGGRVWQNPHTGLLGKLLGTATAVPLAAWHNLTRGSHYNPLTDVATNYWNSPAVTSHLLGHAIDFNTEPGQHPADSGNTPVDPHESAGGPGEAPPPEPGFLKKLLKQYRGSDFHSKVKQHLRHDLATVAGAVPGPNVIFESRANRQSGNALEGLQSTPERDKLVEQRHRQLPAMMGGHVGTAAGYVAGGWPGLAGGRLAGLLGGKAVGSVAGDLSYLLHELRDSGKGVYESMVKKPVDKVRALAERIRGKRKPGK